MDVPLLATYRLQLGPEFSLHDARAVVPYLRALGVSHLYLSPVWAASPGSTHGYDVVDHARISPDLGGLEAFRALAREAAAHEMAIIVDIVPNHVGIADHAWWRDVLRFGPASPYAEYFDIDWNGQPEQSTGVLVYPVLGRSFGEALEAGEFSLAFDGSEIVLRYFDRAFPVAPRHYQRVLGVPPVELDADSSRELTVLLDDLSQADVEAARILLVRFADLVSNAESLRAWVDGRLRNYSGEVGDPRSFDALEAILLAQPYRLAYWRISGEEINYRRFFDINELAAIRVEREVVFEATHRLVRELAEAGMIAGVRVDHIDGLYDPAEYLEKLRGLGRGSGGSWTVWVEKILARGEDLPGHWSVDGTTGYDFLAVAGGLMVDGRSEAAFTSIYQEFIGAHPDYASIAFGARRRVSGRSFAGEVNVLALQLYRLAQSRRSERDITLGAMREAIASTLATMPVYRTYLEDGQPMERDAEIVNSAINGALTRDPNLTYEAAAFLRRVLLMNDAGQANAEQARWVHFRRRFQQLSGPVMAKGVEDTAFFRYHRLLCCNEVGDDPAHWGMSQDEAHRWFERRTREAPKALSGTTTHDTKRSADARMRLAALSAEPRSWHREVRAWARLNRRQRDQGAPPLDPNTEYYLYQMIVASWEGPPTATYVTRLQQHMVKAMREAKGQTSWTRPDTTYEESALAFVAAMLNRRRNPSFVTRVESFVRRLEAGARIRSLGLVALKLTAPGVPDIYQGTEAPQLSLTDPDNRRPVDFRRLAESLQRAATGPIPGPLAEDAKLRLTAQLLDLRRWFPGLFLEGGYRPLAFAGPAAPQMFGYVRELTNTMVAVVIPCGGFRVTDDADGLRIEGAAETSVHLPTRGPWKNWLTGERFEDGTPSCGQLLAGFPVAILVSEAASNDG